MKKLLSLAAVAASVLFLTGCDCPESKKELSDLVVTSAEFVGDDTHEVGDIVDAVIRIFNLFSGDCTQDAAANMHQVALYRRGANGTADEIVGYADYSVPRIKADEGFDDQPSVRFEAPGEYYIGDVVDVHDVVTERDEQNNDKISNGVACAGCKLSDPVRTITVQTTPEFEARVRNGERIPYVTFLPHPNLIRVEVKNYQ